MSVLRQRLGIEEAVARAAADPHAWGTVTGAFAQAFPGTRVHFVGYDGLASRTVLEATTGYADEYLRSYAQHYHHRNDHARSWTHMRAGQSAFAAEMTPEADLLRSEYYNDWLRPQGDLRGGALAILANDRERMFLFGAHVERRVRAATEEPAMRMIRRLAPLMRHALEINRMVLGLRLDATALRQGVEPLDAALLLLSGAGAILYANVRAEGMLAEGTVLAADPLGRLRFADPAAADRLAAALRPPVPRGALAFGLGAAPRAHEVRLMPVTPEVVAQLRMALFLQMRSPVLLVAVQPRRTFADDAAIVRGRLGLSAAEAAIALALADGRTLAEVAEARRTSVHTVRNQVKSILGKLGLRRQAELVGLVERTRRGR